MLVFISLFSFLLWGENINSTKIDPTISTIPNKNKTPNITQHLSHTTLTMLPIIKSASDLHSKDLREQIVFWCQQNPLEDHVYHFPHTDVDFGPLSINTSRNAAISGPTTWVVAGSAALYKVITKFLFNMNERKVQIMEEPNDTDIFFLNSLGPHRAPIGKADIVHAPEKTVGELLLNFDLPCCRAATNSHFDYWISIQALSSIICGNYFMPRYCYNKQLFKEKLMKHRNANQAGGLINGEPTLFDRLQDRIKKYQLRGFGVVWIETEKVLPWIKQRFHYAEWLEVMEPLEVKNLTISKIFETIVNQITEIRYLVQFSINSLKAELTVISNIELNTGMIESLIMNKMRREEVSVRNLIATYTDKYYLLGSNYQVKDFLLKFDNINLSCK